MEDFTSQFQRVLEGFVSEVSTPFVTEVKCEGAAEPPAPPHPAPLTFHLRLFVFLCENAKETFGWMRRIPGSCCLILLRLEFCGEQLTCVRDRGTFQV